MHSVFHRPVCHATEICSGPPNGGLAAKHSTSLIPASVAELPFLVEALRCPAFSASPRRAALDEQCRGKERRGYHRLSGIIHEAWEVSETGQDTSSYFSVCGRVSAV